MSTPSCACARDATGHLTSDSLCPVHAEVDPCLTTSQVTGRRRKGTIRSGVCTNCGWSGPQPQPPRTANVWVQLGPELQEFPIVEVEFDGEVHRCIGAQAVSAFGDRWSLDGEAIGQTRNHTPASADLDGTAWIFATLDAATFRGVPQIRFHFWETVDGESDLWRLDQAPISLVFGVEEIADERKEA